MTPPPMNGQTISNGLEVSVARMEGKLDQVITDHDRRLNSTDSAVTAMVESINRLANTQATNTADIGSVKSELGQFRTEVTADIVELKERQGSALSRAMSVISPVIALGSLALAFIIYTTGA